MGRSKIARQPAQQPPGQASALGADKGFRPVVFLHIRAVLFYSSTNM